MVFYEVGVVVAMLPNTILIGAGKSGTTSLANDLSLHSDVYVLPFKETQFFSYHYHKGLSWYEMLYVRVRDEKIVLDASVTYSTGGRSQEVAGRIHKHIPDARLIMMVREPIKRIESSYVEAIAKGKQAIGVGNAAIQWNLYRGSMYNEIYESYLSYFHADQIHVIFLDDYKNRKELEMRRLCKFLGIPYKPQIGVERPAKNTREEKAADGLIARTLRKIPGGTHATLFLPRPFVLFVKRNLQHKVSAEICWDPKIEETVRSYVRQDTKMFLKRFGKNEDYWGVI